MRLKVAFFTAAFLLPAMVVLGCHLFQRGEQSTPKKLVEAYLEAFRSGDLERMVNLSGGWEGSAEELDFYRKLVEMIELKSYTVDQVEMMGKNEAVVRVTLTMSLLGVDKTQTDRLRVFKEGGKWYLAEGILD